ncbi:hypothetical protein [Corynebacterium ulcerans]|uniref:hypothetical protein n=1 Tax=Corynebacterium ulcerans TaxID=65058 RepID=UPI0018D94C57|nr:hypothetical protein [Corynebacterium ulcerans]MBH5297507.1 hypothetical protein [Corynebacterium ulcerans]
MPHTEPAPATHHDTGHQHTGNTPPRHYHITHHLDVDGTHVTLCGKRFGRRAVTGDRIRIDSLLCPLCDATRALNEVQL